jgi:hypothetical protein
MRVGMFVIVALIALSLPCMELPELAGMYNDASNDFFVMPSRAERPVCAASVGAPHFAEASLNLRGVSITLQSPFRCAPIPHEARLVLNLISIQKK